MTSTARLLTLVAGSAVENMSVDQAILESTGETRVTTLRFYQWDRPTLSLGYFQKLSERDRHLESSEIPCVRRSTGGGAIVHDRELTYSLFMPIAQVAGPQLDLYQKVHDVVVEVLATVGVSAAPFRTLAGHVESSAGEPFLCFQRRTSEDLIVSGYKVLGSAQRKVRGAVLQHGSLLLQSSEHAPQLPGIGELTGRFLSAEELVDVFADRLAKRLELSWSEGSLSEAERSLAAQIAERKFGATAWHQRR